MKVFICCFVLILQAVFLSAFAQQDSALMQVDSVVASKDTTILPKETLVTTQQDSVLIEVDSMLVANDSTVLQKKELVKIQKDSMLMKADSIVVVNDTSTVIQEGKQVTTVVLDTTISIMKPVEGVAEYKEENPITSSAFVIPIAMMIEGVWIRGTSGLYSSVKVRQDIHYHFPNFYTPIDNYMQYVPAIAGYATGFISGTKPRHANGRRLWMFVQSQALMSLSTLALKYYTHELRPNGSAYNSFPSGHTAQAFMGAAFFDMEYPKQMRGVKIGLYALAGLTGALALMNDRHWASDAVFGAGLGMLSVRAIFWSEQFLNRKKAVPKI